MSDQLSDLQQVRDLLARVREHLGRNETREGFGALEAARDLAERNTSGTPEAIEMLAAVYVELGLFHQRLNDSTRGVDYLERAENALRSLPQDGPLRHRLQLATALINATGLLARQRMVDEGLAKVTEALQILRAADGSTEAPVKILLMGALQNKAALEMDARRLADAEVTLKEAVELSATLVANGAHQLLPQAIDVSSRLSMIYRMQQRPLEALPVSERAARWAEAAFSAGAPMGQQLYVTTQLQLVDVNFGARRFAQAEDHMWKAIDGGAGTQTLMIASGFYFSLMRLADEELTAGDLPRDEVEEALDEVLERLEKSPGMPEEALEVLEARRAVLTEGEFGSAEELIVRHADLSAEAKGGLRQLVLLLKSDVEWKKAKSAV